MFSAVFFFFFLYQLSTSPRSTSPQARFVTLLETRKKISTLTTPRPSLGVLQERQRDPIQCTTKCNEVRMCVLRQFWIWHSFCHPHEYTSVWVCLVLYHIIMVLMIVGFRFKDSFRGYHFILVCYGSCWFSFSSYCLNLHHVIFAGRWYSGTISCSTVSLFLFSVLPKEVRVSVIPAVYYHALRTVLGCSVS